MNFPIHQLIGKPPKLIHQGRMVIHSDGGLQTSEEVRALVIRDRLKEAENIIKSSPVPVTYYEVAERMCLSEQAAYKYVRDLVKAKRVKRVTDSDSGRARYW
jgi:hypothetical protein